MSAARRGAVVVASLVAACSHASSPADAPPASSFTAPKASLDPPPPTSAPAASSSAPAAPGPRARCPDGMVDTSKVCIDRFEAPNRKGEKPILLVSATEAEAWCKERDKRLCTEAEWRRSCAGAEGRAFPYGERHEKHACNDDKSYRVPSWAALAKHPDPAARVEAERLDQSEPAGDRPRCTTPEGVHDLVANAAEWVRRTDDHPNGHPHVVMGCSWTKCYRPPHTPTCDYVNYNHPSGWRSYEIGFRCCRDRDGG